MKSDKQKAAFADITNVFLSAMDWDTRWSYNGSLTTPPCNDNVHFEVLSTVLPI
jgi:carbonic anhydrase